MTLAEFASDSKCGFAVTCSSGMRYLQKLIGHPRHGAHDYNRVSRQAFANYGDDALNSCGIGDRGAAEFHYNAAINHQTESHFSQNRGEVGHPVSEATRDRSREITFAFQQLGVEQGRASGATNHVVRKHGELPVEHATWTQTADGRRHTAPKVDIKTRLRAIIRIDVPHRNLRRGGKFLFLRDAGEVRPGLKNFLGLRLVFELDRDRLRVTILDG